MKQSLIRFGVSIEQDLLTRFDALIQASGYVNRSEAFRDLIRARLVDEELQDNKALVFGILTLVYDHHKRDLERKLTAIQHDWYASIIASTHVHIDHENCLEVILLKGVVEDLRHLSASLAGLKGVTHSRLVFTKAEGMDLHGGHSHKHHRSTKERKIER